MIHGLLILEEDQLHHFLQTRNCPPMKQLFAPQNLIDCPFILPQHDAPDIPFSSSLVQRLQRFGSYNRFKQVRGMGCSVWAAKAGCRP